MLLNRIDIIIPVYRGVTQTRACIESVLAAENWHAADVVVMNDASPEPEIDAYLANLASGGRITLVTNPANLGFVATCNLAMQMHADRDVVLLNSDTVVPDHWLDRIVACANAAPMIASVTPFSNNATLCSYPRIAVSNELPSGVSLQELDGMFASVNAGRYVEIPTGVGFCMLMTRAAIDAVGMFDVDAFGRGYGEENDWCMRAAVKGYSHQLCGDMFVYHQGEASFGDSATSGKRQAQAVIDARYPGYREQIARHLDTDPARALRRQVDLARLASSRRPRVLFVTHDWGGGTEKHVNDLLALVSDSLEVLVLKPLNEQSLSLRWARRGEEFEAYFEDRKDPAELLQILRAIGISRLHLHHVHGLPVYVLDLHNALGVPLDITLHDYFPVTQRYHLGPGGTIDTNSDTPANDWGLSDAEWRQRMGLLLGSAARVIAPSYDLAAGMREYFPKIDIQVHAHPDDPASTAFHVYKVLVLGGLTIEKGLKLLEACAIDARERQLPLFFKLIGHTAETVPRFPEVPFLIGGTYREADLEQLIALERADAFLFPSQIPESYSYTLTSAIRTQLPIVASALGAFKERLAGNPHARTIAWNAEPRVWNDTLLAAIGDTRNSSFERLESGTSSNFSRQYVNWYLTPITGLISQNIPKSECPIRAWYVPKIRGQKKEYSLQQLFEIGVERGHGPSLTELRRRSNIADHLKATADAQIAAVQHYAGSLERDVEMLKRELQKTQALFGVMQASLSAERDKAQAAFETVKSSNSWRVTKPLRWSIERARDMRAVVAVGGRSVRCLPQNVATAKQILAKDGPLALIRHLRTRLDKRRAPPAVVAKSFRIEFSITPLTIQSSEAPKFSLIIPVYGQHLLTFTCLKSIAETCAGMAIEVLVIDDCSPLPASEALAAVSGITFIRNETNLGFLKSCNHGATSAKGEFLVILNNDLILTGDWLRQMTAVYSRFPDTGLVGAKLIYPDGRLQEAGGIVWRDGSAWNVGRDDDPGRPEYNFIREVDYCSGACLLIKRDFWDELGGFDEAYVPAYYEDTDLAFRVRAAGKRVFYQPHAVVVHFEGQSSGTDLAHGVKRHQVINQKTFVDRWEKVLAAHRTNGMWPRIEQNRYTGTRVLVIDACMLTPDQDSGSLRMFEMLGLMRAMGHKVTFVASNIEFRAPYVDDIQSLGVEVLHYPYITSIERHIEQHGADYEFVILSRESVATQFLEVVRRHAAQAKIIFDTVDLHFLRIERQAALVGDGALHAEARRMRERELDLINAVDVALVVSPIERDLLAQLAPRADVKIVSNIHVAMPGSLPFAQRSGMLFIGGFRHPPNVDAMMWHVENVLPILRAKQPGLVTTVIGSDVPPALLRHEATDFVIAGYIPDVSPYYHAARLSISPLRYGAGVKGKVNLAMQYGVPVVATTSSVEGMYLCTEKSVLVADEPEAFADAIIRLHTDEALWNRLRQGGLDIVEEWFSRDAAQRALETVLAT